MADFPVDTLRANRIVLGGKDVSQDLGGSNMKTVLVLPTPALAYFEKMVFVVGDRAYIGTSNVETPTSDTEVFWVEV